jgi:hypothetical protein
MIVVVVVGGRVAFGICRFWNPHAYAWGWARVRSDDLGNTLAQRHG